jgi:hypothetical protein
MRKYYTPQQWRKLIWSHYKPRPHYTNIKNVNVDSNVNERLKTVKTRRGFIKLCQ